MTEYEKQDNITKFLLGEYNAGVDRLALTVRDLLTINTLNLKTIKYIDEINLPFITKRFKEIRALAESMYESYTLANEMYRDRGE